MKKSLLILIFAIPIWAFSQDPREFNHGTCIVEYQNSNDSTKYYLTWSSAYNNGWEHNIYNSTIYFNTNGNLITEVPNDIYIGAEFDEAQEPVNATINASNNYILSVWEDGIDSDAPNVRGQIHDPSGIIIKDNWIIAGGTGSQHSANTAHLGNKYLVFYADEAPPSTGGAVLKAKVIDDITGNETQTITFTPNNEDHWWPTSVSNTSNTRTLIVWGNDGYAVRGTVLYENAGTIQQAELPQDYLTNTQQYYYQVEWLENISKFILIARNGAYENITDESQICLIDIAGNITNTVTVNGGIIREAKMAIKWNENNQTYSVFYPTGVNNLTQISIDNLGVIASASNQIVGHPDLIGFEWTSTGIWSKFITDTDGNDLFQNKYIALFVMNDTISNDIVKTPIHLDTSLFYNTLAVNDNDIYNKNIILYPNPTTSTLNINSENIIERITIYNTIGQVVKIQNSKAIKVINLKELPVGVYFIKMNLYINDVYNEYFQKIIKQ